MGNLNEWWDGLSLVLKIYWGLAIPFTFFFMLQLVMTFMGGDSVHDSADVDSEVEGDTGIHFQFFTLKNLVAFFCVFGWTGIACSQTGMSEGSGVIVSVVAGLTTMALMATLLYFLSKTNVSGTMQFSNAIGQSGEVYLPIPALRKGSGKISVKVQGSLRTLDAITDEDNDLPTGKIVIVREIINGHLLLVTSQ